MRRMQEMFWEGVIIGSILGIFLGVMIIAAFIVSCREDYDLKRDLAESYILPKK
jgi:uncharacterized membrane-anchored protein YhcB (DUF1043 family)